MSAPGPARPATTRALRAALILLPVAFAGAFFAYPVMRILWRGIAPAGSIDLSPFRRVLGEAALLEVAWFTLWQAAVSTGLTLLVALPGAYVVSHYRFRGRSGFRAFVTVPFMLPTVVVASAFLALLGPSGILGLDLRGTLLLVFTAHVYFNYAVVLRTVGGLWERLDPRLVDAARALGASWPRAFREVTLPLLRPAIISAAAIVFLFSFTSFGIMLILGDLSYVTLEVEIWRQAVALFNLPVAAALAILQLGGVTAILAFYARYQQRHARHLALRPPGEVLRRPTTVRQRLTVAANLAGALVFLGTPLVVLTVRALRTGTGYGLDHFLRLGERSGALPEAPLGSLVNSLQFAVVAAALGVTIGVAAAVVIAGRTGRAAAWFDTLLMLPLGTSAVTIGFGMLIALDAPIDLRTSWIIIPIAHALVAIPFVVRTTVPVLASISRRLREAAAVLGAGPARTWREIDAPLAARAVAVGAGFACAVSLGEFGATAFLVRPASHTVPTAIFRLLGRPGAENFGAAMALSVVLMAVTALIVMAVDRFRLDGEASF